VEPIQQDLDETLRRGSRYCINFDWLIERDEMRVHKGAYANIYQGTLHPEGRKVAIRIVHQWRRDQGDKVRNAYATVIDINAEPSISLFCGRYRSGASFDKKTSFRCWGLLLHSPTPSQ